MIGLGVDGGGTKTEALLVDHEGHILGMGRAGPTNMFFVSREDAWVAFCTAVDGTLSTAGSARIDAMCVSAEVPDDLLGNLATQYHISAWRHVEEPESALAAGQPFTKEQVRVVICAGTGAMALGIGDQGEHLIAGGGGPLIGDEGSAYWLGQRALAVTFHAFDGRCDSSPLTKRIHQQLGSPPDFRSLIQRVYGPPVMSRFEIAALGPLVTQMAAEGDVFAEEIMREGTQELARLIYALGRRLGLLETSFAVLPFGGVFRAGSVVLGPFGEAVHAVAPQAQVLPPVFHPALGAALMALEHAEAALTPAALQTLVAEREKWDV